MQWKFQKKGILLPIFDQPYTGKHCILDTHARNV